MLAISYASFRIFAKIHEDIHNIKFTTDVNDNSNESFIIKLQFCSQNFVYIFSLQFIVQVGDVDGDIFNMFSQIKCYSVHRIYNMLITQT